MPRKTGKHDKSFYQDVSRITLEGLAQITHEFQDFYQELTNKFQSGLQNAADQELPEASDQLNAIVETTESATTSIMDTLEEMQDEQEKVRRVLSELAADKRMAQSKRNALEQAILSLDSNQNRIMTIFEELSFQDPHRAAHQTNRHPGQIRGRKSPRHSEYLGQESSGRAEIIPGPLPGRTRVERTSKNRRRNGSIRHRRPPGQPLTNRPASWPNRIIFLKPMTWCCLYSYDG